MHTVSLFDAKINLSRIVQDLLSGFEDAVVVSRHGKPVVKIIPFCEADIPKRIGVARGRFKLPNPVDALNPEIEKLFSMETDLA